MKKILKIAFLFIFSLFILSNRVHAEEVYKLGTHLEAENYNVNKLTEIKNNPNASGYKALDAGESGTVEYEVNMATAGTYRLALGYYSGGQKDAAAIKVKVNDSAEVKYNITTFNGWCKDTNRLPIAMDVEVELKAGKNTIVYGAAGKYVNLDYIAIFEKNAPYEAEEMYAHLQADGSRIQAEWSTDVAGGYCDNNIRIADSGTCTDGVTLSVDDDWGSKPGYKVYAQSAGTYIFQVAFYGSNGATPKYLFNVNGTNYNIRLPQSPANWDRNCYSTKAQFEVELNEGINTIYFSYTGSGFADFDWFKLYKKDTLTINQVIEAEDYTLGDANIVKSQAKYPFVSGYAVELAQGSVEFEVEVETEGEYILYVSSFTGTPNAYNFITINGEKSKLTYVSPNGWIDDVDSAFLQEFNINLKAGKNTIVITKGNEDLAYNYIDLDYFVISQGTVLTNSIVLDKETNPEVELSSIITVDNYKVKIANENIVKVEEGKLVIVGGGKTRVEIIYTINGVEVSKIITVEVTKMNYSGNDVKAFDTTKVYTGNKCMVDVEMPEGWSFTQNGDSKDAGEYEVTVTFTHPNYNPITQTVKLTINKAVYEGKDLYAENVEYVYDGSEKHVIASAPSGWTVKYENNGQIEVGEYEVTVIFSHANYEDVVKTVKLNIVNKSGCAGSVVASIMSVSLLGAAIILLRKRNKH